MSKFTLSQNNFISGELSPKLRGRNDVQQYFSGLAKLENFIPYPSGGLGSRPGTVFGLDLGTIAGGTAKIIPYKYNNLKFLIIISAAAIRIEKITNTLPSWKFDFTTSAVNFNASFFAQYSTLSPNQYVVAGNYIFVTDNAGPPISIFYDAGLDRFFVGTYWQRAEDLSEADNSDKSIIRAVPFPARNKSQNITITLNVAQTSATLSSGEFSTDMVGGYLRVKETGNTDESFYRIDVITGTPSIATVTRIIDGGTDPSVGHYEWAISSWHTNNWPKAVGFFQERIIWGGSNKYPDSLWPTATNAPFLLLTYKSAKDASSDDSGLNYSGDLIASDAFTIILGSGEIDSISWITSDRSLQVGTDTVENFIVPVDGIFGPQNFQVVPSTFFGGSESQAVRYQNSTYFIEADNRNIRELTFSEENGSNSSRLLTGLADTLHKYKAENLSITSKYEKMIVWRSKNTILLTNTAKLGMVGVTVDKSTNILAFHKHNFSGGAIEDMAAIKTDLNAEVLFLLITRDDKIYVEYMLDFFDKDEIPSTSMSLSGDSFIPVDSAANPLVNPSSETLAVPHIPEGTEIDVFLRGVYDGRKTVASGTVPVSDDTATTDEILYGIPINKKLETMPIEGGSKLGNSQIQISRVHEVLVRLYKSKGGKLGSSSDRLDDLKYDSLTDTELFTGDITVCFDSNPSEQQVVLVESDDPYPLNILSLGFEGVTED